MSMKNGEIDIIIDPVGPIDADKMKEQLFKRKKHVYLYEIEFTWKMKIVESLRHFADRRHQKEARKRAYKKEHFDFG